MTPDRLLAEGRRLARPCVHLTASGRGEPCAIWHPNNPADIRRSGLRAWLTFDAALLSGLQDEAHTATTAADPFEPVAGFASVFSDEGRGEGGTIQFNPDWPDRPGIALYARRAVPLPPLEAIFLYGSEAVAKWLQDNNWPQDRRYGSGFDDAMTADAYLQQWLREQAMFSDPGVAAVVGGWHPPRGDADWHSLAPERLLVQTLHEAEPWIEAWQLRKGGFKVIRRVT